MGTAQTADEINFDGLSNSNPTPSFDHGYVAAWDFHYPHSVTLYATDGHQMFDVLSLKLPDGTKTNAPLSIAIDKDGTSALAYWTEPGTRSGVAILDSSGNQLRVIETEPYKPSQVCFAPDHSIWMIGDLWQTGDTPASDFMTFRHYARDGKLLGSFVPRSKLPAWEGAGLDQVVAPYIGLWRMRAINDRLGVALGLGSNKEAWVELNFDGKLIGQWTYTFSQQESVMPAAFDSKGVLSTKPQAPGNPSPRCRAVT